MYVSNKDDIPKTPHFAILTFPSIHIPGDERSRTNPGHGYPASTKRVVKYQAFIDKVEWETEIKRLMRLNTNATCGTDFIALDVVPATVQTEYTITSR